MASRQAAPTVRPFPWASLDSVKPSDLAAFRALRLRCSSFIRWDDAEQALGSLVDARVHVRLRRALRGARLRTLEDGVAVVLARADDGNPSRTLLLETESALATTLVARALKRPPPKLSSLAPPPSANIAGALGAIVVAAARSVHQGAPLRVLMAGPSSEVGREYAQHVQVNGVEDATFTVLLDHEAFLAKLAVPSRGFDTAPETWGRAELEALGDVELAMPIIAAVSKAPAAEVASLGVGDAWIPGAWPLAKGPTGAWFGEVWLGAAEAETALRATLGEDGRIVLRGDTIELAWSDDSSSEVTAMGDGDKRGHVTEAVGDLPVVVRVEIGAARMRAREWAALGAGDVVALGRRVAEPVVLRVAGVEVARGELVDIDGEVGVRILARVAAESSDR
jgi:flagellar motor switch/type III secretory pathway protein FliN